MIIIIMSVTVIIMAGNRGGGKYCSQRTTRQYIMTGCVGRGGEGSQGDVASKQQPNAKASLSGTLP